MFWRRVRGRTVYEVALTSKRYSKTWQNLAESGGSGRLP